MLWVREGFQKTSIITISFLVFLNQTTGDKKLHHHIISFQFCRNVFTSYSWECLIILKALLLHLNDLLSTRQYYQPNLKKLPITWIVIHAPKRKFFNISSTLRCCTVTNLLRKVSANVDMKSPSWMSKFLFLRKTTSILKPFFGTQFLVIIKRVQFAGMMFALCVKAGFLLGGEEGDRFFVELGISQHWLYVSLYFFSDCWSIYCQAKWYPVFETVSGPVQLSFLFNFPWYVITTCNSNI